MDPKHRHLNAWHSAKRATWTCLVDIPVKTNIPIVPLNTDAGLGAPPDPLVQAEFLTIINFLKQNIHWHDKQIKPLHTMFTA